VEVDALVMRDTDRDLRSVVLVNGRTATSISIGDLQGRRIATGAVDSPQATLLPLSMLRASGLSPGR
jgi:phosphonate transport system substrate-binding protein